MAAPFDNSHETNFKSLSDHTGEGVVIDIGTGDGRFVSAAAKANPDKFYIGIDANVKPLEKPSMKATRNPSKGGLQNALFVQAAIEGLPEGLDDVADEIHIHFPWGSLLRAVATGDEEVLRSLRRIAAHDCVLEIIIGIDAERDKAEIERLNLPELSSEYVATKLVPKFESAGFKFVESGLMNEVEWSKLETSWARKLQGGARRVTFLVFRAAE